MNLHSNHAHLGDLVWALTFLQRLRGEHTLRCKPEYVEPLRELVEGLPITVEDCSHIPPDSRDCWIACGAFEHQGVRYQNDIDILDFVRRFFHAMAVDVGQPEVFLHREELLCQFPAIVDEEENWGFEGILIINCDPKSGQCPGYSSSEMDALIKKLNLAGHSAVGVEGADLSLVEIGALALKAGLIIGCATGPWHVCQNLLNRKTQRICMLDPMRLNYGDVPILHASNAAEVEQHLVDLKYL